MPLMHIYWGNDKSINNKCTKQENQNIISTHSTTKQETPNPSKKRARASMATDGKMFHSTGVLWLVSEAYFGDLCISLYASTVRAFHLWKGQGKVERMTKRRVNLEDKSWLLSIACLVFQIHSIEITFKNNMSRRRVEGFLDSTKVGTYSVSFPWLIICTS